MNFKKLLKEYDERIALRKKSEEDYWALVRTFDALEEMVRSGKEDLHIAIARSREYVRSPKKMDTRARRCSSHNNHMRNLLLQRRQSGVSAKSHN